MGDLRAAARGRCHRAQPGRLALALRGARWLQEVQLVVVDAASQRLGVTRGRVSRLVGPAPFDDLRHQFDATWRGNFSSGLVHIGRHDASCWLVSPLLHAEPAGLLLLDGVAKSGAPVCANPLALNRSGPSATLLKRLPTADGDLDWFSVLRSRLELSPTLRFPVSPETSLAPHLKLALDSRPPICGFGIVSIDDRVMRKGLFRRDAQRALQTRWWGAG